MNKIWIGNGQLVLPDKIVPGGSVLLEGKKIAAVNVPCPPDARRVDVDGSYIMAGFQCFELPLYINWYNAGLVSTNIGFIIARAGLQISISLTAVTGFIKTVPRDLEQAAMMDGCNRFQCFWKVVFPLMTPINVTQLVLNTLFIWNDYSTSIILLRKKYSFTLTLAQIIYFNENTTMLNEAFAFFIMAMIPILILYLCMQKYIVSGITAGAVKG